MTKLLRFMYSIGLRYMFAVDPHLSVSNHISRFLSYIFMHTCYAHLIWPMLYSKSASTISIPSIHSRHDYRNSLFRPRIHPTKVSAPYPRFTCTGCYQNTQVSSYHSYPQTTRLVKNPRANPPQSLIINLQLHLVLPAHHLSRTFHYLANTLYQVILLIY